jgi:Translation initiation factor IF-2, N-terminal region.
MTVTSKVRLYDLAKELKLDTKRLIEEVRREGVDVSVPSNSISKELADKIRNKYFPKKEASAPRAVRVVKKAVRPVEAAPVEAAEDEVDAPAVEAAAAETSSVEPTTTTTTAPSPETVAPQPQQQGQTARPVTARLVKKLSPAARAEHPDLDGATATQTAPAAPAVDDAVELADTVEIEPSAVTESTEPQIAEPQMENAELPLAASETTPAQAPRVTTPPPAPSRQIRALRPTAAALNAGVRPGERAPMPTPPPMPAAPAPRERERGRERHDRSSERNASARPALQRTERGGTPGETATPQTLYTPPPDARRRGRSTRTTARGGRKVAEGGKGGRFGDRDFIPPPKALSLEDRIAGRMEMPTASDEHKPVRLVEGSTVKEFAEKLGIKPKDIVTLLLQRGVFATINQPLNDDVAVDLGHRFGYDVFIRAV